MRRPGARAMRRIWRSPLAALAAAAALAGSLAACGYSTGLRLAPQYDSYGVEIFSRDGQEAPVRNLERNLASAMTRSAIELVDGELVAPSDARVVFRGRISTYATAAGVRSATNELLEQSLEIIVRAELWDRQRRRIVSGPVTASARMGYVISNTSLQGQDAQIDAQGRVLKNLADRIVIELILRGAEPEEAEEASEPTSNPAPERTPVGNPPAPSQEGR